MKCLRNVGIQNLLWGDKGQVSFLNLKEFCYIEMSPWSYCIALIPWSMLLSFVQIIRRPVCNFSVVKSRTSFFLIQSQNKNSTFSSDEFWEDLPASCAFWKYMIVTTLIKIHFLLQAYQVPLHQRQTYILLTWNCQYKVKELMKMLIFSE